MTNLHECVPPGNRRAFLATVGLAGIAAVSPASGMSHRETYIDQTLIWLRDRFMQAAHRVTASINSQWRDLFHQLSRIALAMAELPARAAAALEAKREVASWELVVDGDRLSYDVVTKLALVESIRRDERMGAMA